MMSKNGEFIMGQVNKEESLALLLEDYEEEDYSETMMEKGIAGVFTVKIIDESEVLFTNLEKLLIEDDDDEEEEDDNDDVRTKYLGGLDQSELNSMFDNDDLDFDKK